eukprot:13808872-Alexandrium_andersonii.AAC.1
MAASTHEPLHNMQWPRREACKLHNMQDGADAASSHTARLSPAPCIDPQSEPPFSKRPKGRRASPGRGRATSRNARTNSPSERARATAG